MRRAMTLLVVAASACAAYADGLPTPEQDAVSRFCSGRAKRNWEGRYTCTHASSIRVLHIEGQATLYIAPYRLADDPAKRTVIDVFVVEEDMKVRLLYEGAPNKMGTTDRLDSIDVLPSENEAEVILRWRCLGNGGLRSVEKFIYDSKSFILVNASSFGGRHDPVWSSAKAMKQKVQAPSPRVQSDAAEEPRR